MPQQALRLAQPDPALTQRLWLHDVTPCHRRRPPASAGWCWAYFSQPIFGDDRSLCSPVLSPPVPRQWA